MKVIINASYGFFTLSNEAVQECVKRGMTVSKIVAEKKVNPEADFTDYGEVKFYSQYDCPNRTNKAFRCNPKLIEVIETLGPEKAGSRYTTLKVVDIPFDSTSGWYIECEGGKEHICEEHRTWA